MFIISVDHYHNPFPGRLRPQSCLVCVVSAACVCAGVFVLCVYSVGVYRMRMNKGAFHLDATYFSTAPPCLRSRALSPAECHSSQAPATWQAAHAHGRGFREQSVTAVLRARCTATPGEHAACT